MSAGEPSEFSIMPNPLEQPATVHQPFSWLHFSAKHDAGAQFAAMTMDVCNGVGLCLEILHADDMTRLHNNEADPGDEERPAFRSSDIERLLRLALTSTNLLAEAAAANIERANERARLAERSAS